MGPSNHHTANLVNINRRRLDNRLLFIAPLLYCPYSQINAAGDEFEKRLSEIIADQPELARKVTELKADYDNKVFDTEMGDLKDWLQEKGVRLD